METHAFSLSGSMATSQKKLKQKAMRSYFSLKKMIDFKRDQIPCKT